MKRFFTSVLIFGMLIALSGDIYAQTVKISAELRPRYEFRHGFKTLFPDGQNPANYISQRTRLNAFFANNTFKAYISLQDVRVWGDVNQLNTKDVNGFGVHEAWGQIKFCDVFSLKLGRQEVSYDDQRMFGAVGWAQQARSHDAAIFKFFFGDNNKVDLGIAYNAMQESLYKVNYTNSNYRWMQWVHYHGDYGKKSGLSVLVLNNGFAYDADPDPENFDEKIAYSRTAGVRYSFKSKAVKFNVALYWQGGKNKANRNLSSGYFGGDISFHLVKGFSFGLGGEYLSGTATKDKADSDYTDKSFTPFYGTNHKFNGWMDYFYVGNHGSNVGLIDIYVPIKLKVKKLSLALIPHGLMSAAIVSTSEIVVNETVWKDYKRGLGLELDFSIAYAVTKSVVIAGGYSQMFATETMQVVKYPNDVGVEYYKNLNNWAWIMISFKPMFFNSDNKKK